MKIKMDKSEIALRVVLWVSMAFVLCSLVSAIVDHVTRPIMTKTKPSDPIVEFVHGYAETKVDLPNWTPYVPTNEAARIMIPLYWAGVCDGYAAAMKEGKTNLTELYDTMARKMDRTVAGR